MTVRARIADVAQAAGVSTATVSRALSKPEQVGEETRERVMEAVRQTGYRIHSAARDLRQRRARSILILAPNLANTFFGRIFAAVQDEASVAGLTVQISDSRTNRDRLASLGYDGSADGIILLDGTLDPKLVNEWQLPMIQLCEWNDAYNAPGLAIDNRAAARLAVAHLAGLGHKQLLHVEGPRNNVLAAARKRGFEEECAARGANASVLPGDFTMESGALAARAWAKMADRPGAVFCASDECAIGFISEVVRLGFAVPQDVSVIGFDDIDFADRFLPGLTTIHQPRGELGRAAARELIAMISDTKVRNWQIRLIDVHLVARASTSFSRRAGAG